MTASEMLCNFSLCIGKGSGDEVLKSHNSPRRAIAPCILLGNRSLTRGSTELASWLATRLPGVSFALDAASADASFRRYFRVAAGGRSWIAMDAPPEHEDCRPFVRVAAMLRAAGVNAPEVIAQDLDRGFLLAHRSRQHDLPGRAQRGERLAALRRRDRRAHQVAAREPAR